MNFYPIFKFRKYANEEIHQTSIHWKKLTDGLGFQVFQGRASRYGLREIRCAVGSARPRWCHEGWDPRRLRSGGEEVQSGSRDGLLNGSPDGWFSCSKTTDSAVRRRSPDFQFLGITYFIGKLYIKFRLWFHGPKWRSRKQFEINYFPGKQPLRC